MQKLPGAEHWLAVSNSWWRQPEGPGSSLEARMDHPVIHISWNDADAYCNWKGKRLPTEAEWEFAARGGLKGKLFPWGNEEPDLSEGSIRKVNFWQGKFPTENTNLDGYITTAPVDAFAPNAYGLYNVIGNVWEWTADKYFNLKPDQHEQRILKGGSWIDSIDGSFNHRIRVYTRMGNTPDSGATNVGFRCAQDVQRDEL